MAREILLNVVFRDVDMGCQVLCSGCRKEVVICSVQDASGVVDNLDMHYLGMCGASEADEGAKLCADGAF